jgi:hypothetical protein
VVLGLLPSSERHTFGGGLVIESGTPGDTRDLLAQLKEEERAKLQAKAEFDAESRATSTLGEGLWSFVNSSFGLFLMGTVALGVITHLYAEQSEKAKHRSVLSEEAQRAISPALTEIDYRLGALAYSLLFTAEPILQRSRSHAPPDRVPLFGRHYARPDSGTGLRLDIEIEPHTLDVASLIPKYKDWPFRAVVADLRSTVALIPRCVEEVESFQASLVDFESVRPFLERLVRRRLNITQTREIDLELWIPELIDGGLNLSRSEVVGLPCYPIDGGTPTTLEAPEVLEELQPLVKTYVDFLDKGRDFRRRMDACRSLQ